MCHQEEAWGGEYGEVERCREEGREAPIVWERVRQAGKSILLSLVGSLSPLMPAYYLSSRGWKKRGL
jgi:hypothetical protein